MTTEFVHREKEEKEEKEEEEEEEEEKEEEEHKGRTNSRCWLLRVFVR